MDKSDKLSTYIRNSSSVAFFICPSRRIIESPKTTNSSSSSRLACMPMRSRNPCIAIDHDESAYASEVQTKAQNKSPAVSFARRYFQSPRAAYQPKALRAGSEGSSMPCKLSAVSKREHQPPSGAPLRFETLFDGSCPQPCEAFRILCSIVHSAKVEEMSPRCLPASGKQWISG